MTSELYQMKVGRYVPLWYNYITLYREWRGIVWKYTAVLGVAPNYNLSLTFGPMRHIDVIASHLLFSPLTQTKYLI